MRTTRFGRTEEEVPTVSLGTWGHGGPNTSEGSSVGWSGNDDEAARQALVAGYRAGITHWDTADAYGGGHAEKLIGSVWADVPRDEIFLASKFGWVKGPSGRWYDPEFMRSQCEASLRNMQTEVIDLYYFHHSDFGPQNVYLDDALAMMRRLREEGKVRFIGLSDWRAAKIMAVVERIDPDVVQSYRNVVDDDYESSGLKAYVDDHDLGVAFFSPLKHGLLLGKYEGPQHFPVGDFRRNIPQFEDAELIARMRRAAEAIRNRFSSHPEPVLHALIGALLTDNPTATVLLGQRNARQTAAASKVGEPLTKEDAEWVRDVFRG